VQQHGVGDPLVATDTVGNTVFMWSDDGALYTRSRMADGTLTPIQRITPPGDTAPPAGIVRSDLAVDPAGNAYFAWSVRAAETKVRVRVRSADGTLGPVQTVANGPSFANSVELVAMGVGANGRAVFTWVRGNRSNPQTIQARSRSNSGQFGPVRTVAQEGDSPQMAVDASGNATFAWRVSKASDTVWTRILTAAGTLGEPKRVSRAGYSGRYPHVGVSRQGRAVFEWEEVVGSHRVLMVRGRTPDGSLQPIQLLAKADAVDVDMAVAPNGAAVTCWVDGNFDIRERGRTSGGTLGPLRTVTPPVPNYVRDCHQGIDSDGNVAFAWTEYDGSKQRIYARSGMLDGTLGPVQTLSPAGFNAGVPDLTVAPDGTAPVAWSLGRKGFAIQAAFGP
jgi:hypothetical protein